MKINKAKFPIIRLSLFELVTLHWISLAIGALIFALLGVFHVWLLLLWLVADIAGTIYFVKKGTIQIEAHSKSEIAALALLFLFGVLLSAFTTPTIFGGRDEGSFSNAAILLSQDHELTHQSTLSDKFFEIYGEGKALNFPGFIYTKDGSLKSQFLPGYTAWTGIFYSFFGLAGLQFVNFLSFITFLFSFYLILKRLAKNKKIAFWGLAIMATFLPLIVFYKFTLTELFFASLVWFSLHLLLKYFEKKTFAGFLLAIFPLFLAPFVRIEAVAIIFVLFLILIFMDFSNAKKTRYQLWYVLLGLVVLLSIIINRHFFVEALKGFGGGFLPDAQTSSTLLAGQNNSLVPDDWQNFYLPKVLFNYGILALILLSTIYVISLFRKKNWSSLIPLFFLAPTLIYLVDANVTLDHPWMLRRFIFSIVPLALLYSMLLLYNISRKYTGFAWFIVTILLLTNIFQSALFIIPSQNRTLLFEIENLSKNFGENDLILVGQRSSGNGWSLISEPLRNLYGVQAVYFFRPSDLDELIPLDFDNIYLVVSNEELTLFKDLKVNEKQLYQIHNEIIKPSRDPLEKPRFEMIQTEGVMFEIAQ